MASKAAYKRLSKEYVAMHKEPLGSVWAPRTQKNILTWNYIIRGPPDSPYAGGEYHGVLLFPSEYPFKPPGIKVRPHFLPCNAAVVLTGRTPSPDADPIRAIPTRQEDLLLHVRFPSRLRKFRFEQPATRTI
ncbi:hypothetical protein NUW54_g3980 [Trametes sanguinea]|uniref:Uncharacterized protein n=1 Tax=Trametes sanguinea TaxID=158606 RepID=A0ACC1PZS8_9APHY|nr:hypothetical protein NUW54_g3980 [Trametes sanguinea]